MPADADDTSSRFVRWRSATLAPFEHRTFAFFWWASLASSFGSMVQTVGASWLMTTIAPSPDMVALVQTASALPFFFLSLVAGALADTRDRRLIMLVSQLVALLASLALAIIALSGGVTPAVLLALTFAIGCGAALYAPTWQASIADQVPRPLIPSAVMANAAGFNLARSLGPALGGVIVAALGTAVAFVVNAVSYVGIIATLVWWRPNRVRSELPPEPLGAALGAGLRYVSLSPHLRSILLRCVLHTVPIVAVPSLIPVVARDLLKGGAGIYGLLLGGFGVGAMLGALASATLRNRFTSDELLRGLSGLACLSVVGIAQSRWPALTFLATILCGCVWTLGLALLNISVQLSSPRWVTARMLATYQTTVFASVALGSWAWGEFAATSGLREALTVAGVAALASLIAARWFPISVDKLAPLEPGATLELTPPTLGIGSTSGPIIVAVEYRVQLENAANFVSMIYEIGRIRRRDGARAWSISQDIDALDLWIERFEFPTWLDYLRWRTRPTAADRAMREDLRRLIAGENVAVRRLVVRPPGSQILGEADSAPAQHDRW
jgi:predicted MFS family arabinose efflux permease